MTDNAKAIEDLRKAIFFINDEIKKLETTTAAASSAQ